MNKNKAILIILYFLSFLFILPSSIYSQNILFEDNFLDDSKWTPLGSWLIFNQEYIGQASFTDKENPAYTVAGDSSWTNYSFEADIKGVEGADKGIMFRYNNFDYKYALNIRNKSLNSSSDLTLTKNDINGLKILKSIPFDNELNKWYRVKIKVIRNEISIYINNNFVMYYKDEDNYITSGKIGLQIWPGNYTAEGNCITTTVYDNVRVTDIGTSSIVFIPGHGGSWNIDDIVNNTSVNEWTATPFIHVYDRLFNALENTGFTKDSGLFYPFYYDWRQKTDASSDKLETFIENILQNKPPDTQVVILAHSYGGLVARNYLQRYGDRHGGLSPPVNKILTVASPHEGVLEAFAAWEGGEVWRDDVLQRMAFEIPITLQQTKYLTRKEAVRNFAPSTLDLFPIFNFLIDENDLDIPIDSMAVKNSWLSSLKSNLIGNDLLSAKINIFYGNSLKTLESIKITKNFAWYDKLLNNWEDGKPMVRNYSDEGDGTVLVKSAKINNVLVTEALLGHTEMVDTDEGIAKIFALLDLGTPTITLNKRPVFASALALILHSPAQLKVIDSNGSSIGFQSGVDLIPDADTDLQNKLIVISNPKEEYQVSVFGTDTGDYKLEAIFDDGTKKTTRTLEGVTKSGQVDNYNININSDISISDTTGSYSFIQAKKQIEILKTRINNSTMNKNSKSTLIRLLNSRSNDIDDILSLISKNKKEKAGLSTESLIKSLFSFRTRLAATAKNEANYLSLKGTSWEIISLVKDGYLDSLTFPSMLKLYEQKQLINKSLNKNESLLTKTSKKKNIKESAVSFALAKNMNDEMQKYILAGDYNKAYINSFLILYLIDESMSFSALL